MKSCVTTIESRDMEELINYRARSGSSVRVPEPDSFLPLDPVVDRSSGSKIKAKSSRSKNRLVDQVDRVESIFSLIESIDLLTTNRVKNLKKNLRTCMPSLRNGQMAEISGV